MITTSTILPEEKEAFTRDGYFSREGVLSETQIAAVKSAFSELVRKYANDRELADVIRGEGQHVAMGTQFKSKSSDFFFQLESGQEPRLDDMDALELQIRKFMHFDKEAAIFEELLGPEGPLQSVVRDILEDDLLLFQPMALIKPPKIGATKPWHQDNAYFTVKPLDAVVGVWMALDEATPKNGCMHMIKGGHHAGAHVHELKRDCEINVKKLDLKQLEPIPLKPGGALFFSGMVPHETPPNRSDKRRRALQFHFRTKSSKLIPNEDYDKVFCDAEGRPGSCEVLRRQGI